MDLELRDLRYALALARHGSYTRAAAALGLTQPALSRSIQGLERSLGVRLFDRGRHGAEPTPFGRTLLEHAERVIDEAEELRRRASLQRARVEGDLIVQAGTMASLVSVSRACGLMINRHPGLRVHLVTTSDLEAAIQAVRERRAELAVVELPGSSEAPDAHFHPLPRHRGAFVCRPGHPLTEHDSLDLQRILEYPLVAPRLSSRIGDLLRGMPARGGHVDPDSGDFLPTLTIEAAELAGPLIRCSDAVTLTALVAVAEELEAGTVVALPFSPPWLHSAYGIVVRKGRTPSPAAEALMAEIHEIESGLAILEESLLGRIGA